MGLDMFLDYRRIADSIPGKPALNEHLRLGLDHLMDLIKDAAPTD